MEDKIMTFSVPPWLFNYINVYNFMNKHHINLSDGSQIIILSYN